MKPPVRAFRSGAVGVMLWSLGSAMPVPALNVDELIARADLIAIGTVQTISEQGRTVVDTAGASIPATEFVAEVLVDHTLKGQFLPLIRVQFVVLDRPVGYERVAASQYRILFLKGHGESYQFVSPYYPSLAAVPMSSVQGNTAAEKVADALGAVARSPNVASNERRNALGELNTIKSAATVTLLRQLLGERDDAVRLTAASYLLTANDVAGLEMVERALLESTAGLPDEIVLTLRYGLSHGLTTEAAIPSLSRILASPDPATRRAATEALRHVGSPATGRALARALNDSDFDVRYYAVVALSEITGEKAWRPSPEEFRMAEARYLEYWRRRAAGRR
jgi:hypothetical protein